MGKIKQNKEEQHPPALFFVAAILPLILTATQKWALLWGNLSHQILPEQGHALHVPQVERPCCQAACVVPGEGLGGRSGVRGRSTGDTELGPERHSG